MKNSRLPFGPGRPESTTPSDARTPSRRGLRARLVSDFAVQVPDRERRPSGRRRGPASNCGLTSTSASQPGCASRSAGGKRVRTEMKETSQTTSSGCERELRQRPDVRPLEHRHARVGAETGVELPVARRRARSPARAPAWSKQSVKPPVEAPTSRQSRPAGSTSSAVERVGELLTAARDEARRALHSSSAVSSIWAPACRSRGRGRQGRAPAPGSVSRQARARRAATSSRFFTRRRPASVRAGSAATSRTSAPRPRSLPTHPLPRRPARTSMTASSCGVYVRTEWTSSLRLPSSRTNVQRARLRPASTSNSCSWRKSAPDSVCSKPRSR